MLGFVERMELSLLGNGHKDTNPGLNPLDNAWNVSDLYEKLGEYGFQNAILVRYTQKAPQVSTPTLATLSTPLSTQH